MKPLNLRNLIRGLNHEIVRLEGQDFEYLTCDTRTATFRRISDGRHVEFDLTVNNDVLGWNGVTFQGQHPRYSAKRRAPHFAEPETFEVSGCQ